MVLLRYSREDFLVLGLKLCGFSSKRINKVKETTKLLRFADKYYISPDVCSTLYEDIQSNDIEDRIENPNPSYLLLSLYYLKKYPTKHEMAGFLDCCEDTALKYSKLYAKAIAALKATKSD